MAALAWYIDADLQDYLLEISRAAPLTAEDERRIGWKIINEDCPASRQRLVRASLPLVVAIARTYSGRGLDLGRLIEEGTIGLLRAVADFDPVERARFSTRASWWIRQAIREALSSVARPVDASEQSATEHPAIESSMTPSRGLIHDDAIAV